jgi:microcompartment protein CcmL/EutN
MLFNLGLSASAAYTRWRMSTRALGLIETQGMVGAMVAADAAIKHAAVTIEAAEIIDGGFVVVRLFGQLADVQAAVEAGAQAAQKLGQLWASKVIPRPDEEMLALFGARGLIGAKPVTRASVRSRSRMLSTSSSFPTTESESADLSPAAKEVREPSRRGTAVRKSRKKAQMSAPSDRGPAIVPPVHTTPGGAVNWTEVEAMSVVKLRQFCRNFPGLPIQGRQISMANRTQLLEALRAAAGV